MVGFKSILAEKSSSTKRAQKDVKWEKIRAECTSLACTWTLYYRTRDERSQSQSEVSERITLYEKDEASGVWSWVAQSGPGITNKLVDWCQKNKDDEEEKMVLGSD